MRFVRIIPVVAVMSQLLFGQGKPAILGTWGGQSLCEQKESACRDETVVYRFSPRKDTPGSFSVSADKIVGGKAVNMGTLEFRYVEEQHALVCEYVQGVWRLSVNEDRMEGTLTRSDGIVVRHVALHKEHSRSTGVNGR